MPHAHDVQLLQFAQTRGLIGESLAAACMSEIIASEQAGRPLRLAQVLLRRRVLSSSTIQGLMQEMRDVVASGEKVVGSETFHGMATTADRSTGPSGDSIGGYALLREIARGGMGILFEGRTAQGEPVAVKVLSAEATQDPSMVRRFRQEAELAATLSHPNLIKVHEAGFDQGLHFLVMDFFVGRSLAELIRPGRLAPKKALEVGATVAEACGYMHGCGVIHRDLKPGNIMVGKEGRVCLVDFGLAKDLLRQGTILTQLGKLVGTPAYMAPEQARGELSAVGPWSDVYSVGAVLFRAITGRYPHAGQTFMKTIQAISTQQAPPLRSYRPDAPAELDAIVSRAMSLDPRARPEAGALAHELRDLLATTPVVMPPAPPSDQV
jgi:serine/threonine protein kinase